MMAPWVMASETRTWTKAERVAPAATVPRVQVTTSPVSAQKSEAPTKVVLTGTLSVMMTPTASDGPVLVMRI